MLVRSRVTISLVGVCLLLITGRLRASEGDLFETQVRPLLAQHCYKCHGPTKQKGGIRLDGPDHLAKSGDGEGPVVVPGDPARSRLIKAVLYLDEAESKMPPAGKLPDAAIEALTRWVKEGAAWPVEKKPQEQKLPAAAQQEADLALLYGADNYLILHNVACIYAALAQAGGGQAPAYQDVAMALLQV